MKFILSLILSLMLGFQVAVASDSGGSDCSSSSGFSDRLIDRIGALEVKNNELQGRIDELLKKINELSLLRVNCKCSLTPGMPAIGKGINFAKAMESANISCQSQSRLNYFYDENYVSDCELIGYPGIESTNSCDPFMDVSCPVEPKSR